MALETFPEFRLVILYGSAACDALTPESDIDIAYDSVCPLSAAVQIQIIEKITLATGRPVDLVRLENASCVLLARILTNGKVLIKKDPLILYRYLQRLVYASADFMPLQRNMLAARRREWIGM